MFLKIIILIFNLFLTLKKYLLNKLNILDFRSLFDNCFLKQFSILIINKNIYIYLTTRKLIFVLNNRKQWVCLVTIFEKSFLFSGTKKEKNKFDNKKLFYILKNIDHIVFEKHLLVVFHYFHLFSKRCFKK